MRQVVTERNLSGILQCKRGDMFFADLGPFFGSEQGGVRPVVILQNDVGNRYSPTTIIAPLSSKIYTKAHLPTHCFLPAENGLQKKSIVLLEHTQAIDKKRLSNYIGHLDEKSMSKIDQALAISIGLLDISGKDKTKKSKCLDRIGGSDFRETGGQT